MTRERPILFSGAMVRAILEGRKTQTRRVVKGSPTQVDAQPKFQPNTWGMWGGDYPDHGQVVRSPYGEPGEQLWVREMFSFRDRGSLSDPDVDTSECWYCADGNVPTHGNWTRPKPSIHMPRSASRMTLEVVGVRVERLQAISEDGARAEGCHELPLQGGMPGAWWTFGGEPRFAARTPCAAFRLGWDSINGRRAPWSLNPWVWVVEFRRLAP